jgi:hypothetical protein
MPGTAGLFTMRIRRVTPARRARNTLNPNLQRSVADGGPRAVIWAARLSYQRYRAGSASKGASTQLTNVKRRTSCLLLPANRPHRMGRPAS